MMKNNILYFLLFLFFIINAQERVFLSIGDENITIDDFMKNYYKNRLDTDTLEFQQSLNEYLDLYTKFKLKVVEAKALGLDTTPSFTRELSGYRKQLVKPYLTDSEVSENLLKEAYERLKYEVSASHILIQTNSDDTLDSYNQVKDIKQQLNNGANFIDLAKQYSDDPSVKENDGNLGYFSALYMVYPFESAAYQTPVGQISDPIKTRFGYHILKINDKRLSRGEVKVAHILVKINNKLSNDSVAVFKINELYDSLVIGADFAHLARQYSDDKKSAQKGGELDWFGTNKMVKSFEDVAFSLDSIGAFSKPMKTEFGWHIIKLLNTKQLPSYEDMRESLSKRIERDSRSQKTRNIVLSRLIEEWGFVENIYAKEAFYSIINQDVMNSNFDISQNLDGNGLVMFVFNNNFNKKQRYVYQKDFADFFNSFKTRLNKQANLKNIIDELYKTFKEQKILEIESKNLESKYDDFRLLYNEYHDGILMYQLQKEKVWDKAVIDSIGLNDFFINNQASYMWDDRVNLRIYNSKDSKINSKVYRNLKSKKSYEYILEKINKKSALNLSISDSIYSKGDNTIIDSFVFDLGFDSLKKGDHILIENTNKIIELIDILPASPKSLTSIKGVVISDYQSFLESEWLSDLREKYIVKVDQDLFSLAKNEKLIFKDDNTSTIEYTELSFEEVFSKTVNLLGSSKDVFFGWNNNIYTTEIKPREKD